MSEQAIGSRDPGVAPPSPAAASPAGGRMRELRRRFGRPLQSLAYHSGIMRLSTQLLLRGANGAVILMYHSVADGEARQWIDPSNHVPADVFEQQMEFLARHRRVIALAELIELLRRGTTPPTGTTVITFDDGYLDNLIVAAPILDRLALPATLYLPTGYIDRAEPQWIDQIYWMHQRRTVQDAESAKSAAAYRAICLELLAADPQQRAFRLSQLHQQLQPVGEPPQLTMSWGNVKALLAQYRGFEIGAHTVEHLSLTDTAAGAASDELESCRQRVEEQTGRRPQHFSFPYGRTSPQLRALVARTGFESACGGGKVGPVITASNDPFALPRIDAPASMKRFAVMTSAANRGLWRKLGR